MDPTRPHVIRVAGRLWRHLHPRRRRQLGLLGGLIGLSAVCEIVSLGALLPFLQVLAAPDEALSTPSVQRLVFALGIASSDRLVLVLAGLFAAAAISSALLRLVLMWAFGRLGHAISGDLGVEIYRRTLYQPYQVQVARNSSSVIAGITHNVDTASKMLIAQLNLATDAVLLLGIVSALLVIHPVAATVAGLGFGASYLLVSMLARRRLMMNGLVIAREQGSIIRAVQEGLGGIRDVLLDGTQPVYADIYRRASAQLRRAAGDNHCLTGAPRYVMEAVGIVLVIGLAGWLSSRGTLAGALPVLGVLALGAQRLLPVMQQAYASWTSIVFSVAPVTALLDVLDQPLPPEAHEPPPAPLVLRQEVRFDAVSFRYAADLPLVLDGLSLRVPKGARVGIVGGTGSGKSTLLDLLVGLLEPTAGSIAVDGLPITGPRLRAWQRSVAHVPQSIYLADCTIAENIAFGIPPAAIDMDRVRQAAAEAQIAAFVEGLPAQYASLIGERGVRLSGGQRQRIGIARALYKRGSVLVLDEATSALDNLTEQSVMDTIEGLARDLTIIIIAHRVTTVRRCDRLVELIGGRAVEYASYEQMVDRSPSARQTIAVPVVVTRP